VWIRRDDECNLKSSFLGICNVVVIHIINVSTIAITNL